jgi:hypothetical protein
LAAHLQPAVPEQRSFPAQACSGQAFGVLFMGWYVEMVLVAFIDIFAASGCGALQLAPALTPLPLLDRAALHQAGA